MIVDVVYVAGVDPFLRPTKVSHNGVYPGTFASELGLSPAQLADNNRNEPGVRTVKGE